MRLSLKFINLGAAMNCPHCDRLLYSRQHKVCGFCGGELSGKFLLAEHEVAELKDELKEIAERMARDKAKEEERNKRRSGDGGGDAGPVIGF